MRKLSSDVLNEIDRIRRRRHRLFVWSRVLNYIAMALSFSAIAFFMWYVVQGGLQRLYAGSASLVVSAILTVVGRHLFKKVRRGQVRP